MNGLLALTRKELRIQFSSPPMYIATAFLLSAAAMWFFLVHGFLARDTATLRGYFAAMPLLLVLVIPALTMKGWAEEYRLGTSELLLTLPLRSVELVVGKYLGTMLIVLCMLLLTLPVAFLLMPLGEFDLGQIVTEYIGTILISGTAVALGLFISVLCTNQSTAFTGAAGLLLVLTLIGRLEVLISLPGPLAGVLRYVSLDTHFDGFVRGVLDFRALWYYLWLTSLCLYLTAVVLEARRRA
ncbi:MAG: ABC transporter permease [Spirochaetaceae bacterium]|nr:MAG: ABC transporter permease [Spirochaetaceae bacterium]